VVFKTTAIRHPSASKSPASARFPVRQPAVWPGVTKRVTVAEHAAVLNWTSSICAGGDALADKSPTLVVSIEIWDHTLDGRFDSTAH
jgi:hypothetical protein